MFFPRLLPCLLLLSASWGRCAQPPASADLKALYFADLGPDAIDVASYPKEQQERYQVFRRICSRCHTLARAVNSPRAGRATWDIYILGMRLRSTIAREDRYSKKEGRAVLDFLVYDAQRRKTGHPEFELLCADLQSRFAGAIAERMRRLQERNPKISP